MRFPGNLRDFIGHLLPRAGKCGQNAAAELVRGMLVGYTTQLAQLARQAIPGKEAEDERVVKRRYQYFSRWLNHPKWDPDRLYTGLNRQARRWLAHRRHVPLLMDITDLGDTWSVLQVSFPFERRALPLYRSVVHHTHPERHRRELVRDALLLLQEHLPGPLSRYVLVADRGFPGHWLVKALQQAGWRFVLRVTERWGVEHAQYTGELAAAPQVAGLVGPRPRHLADAFFGRKGQGADEWSQAHLVLYHGEGRKEPWYLVTSERRATRAVSIYRERMKIECEFRDVKGPFGLDALVRWEQRERVARFLAMVAVYEWRLAVLWVRHRIGRHRKSLSKYGKLSWIRLTREWIQLQIRLSALPAILRL
jgi:Transposase DDE domain